MNSEIESYDDDLDDLAADDLDNLDVGDVDDVDDDEDDDNGGVSVGSSGVWKSLFKASKTKDD